MKIPKVLRHGNVIILFGLMHTQLALSKEGFGRKFNEFAQSGFFQISKGIDELPAVSGTTDFETLAAFWFFYFGILLIPVGLLLNNIARNHQKVPYGFLISYLLFLLVGTYMIPKSGMTYFMLPHALFMLVQNLYKSYKSGKPVPSSPSIPTK